MQPPSDPNSKIYLRSFWSNISLGLFCVHSLPHSFSPQSLLQPSNMRVIALVSLALALAASSVPLSTRSDGVSASQDGSSETFGFAGNENGYTIHVPSSDSGSGSEDEPSGTHAVNGSGSGNIYVAGSSAIGSLESFGHHSIASTGGDVPGVVKDATSQVLGRAESAVGHPVSVTNSVTRITFLPPHNVIESGSGGDGVVGLRAAFLSAVTALTEGRTVSVDVNVHSPHSAGSGSNTRTGSTSS